MEYSTSWLETTQRDFTLGRSRLGDSECRRLHLDLWERAAMRIHQFSGSCDTCRQTRIIVSQLAADCVHDVPSGEKAKECHRMLDHVLTHLHHTHRLIQGGHFTLNGLIAGTAAGMTLELILLHPIAGIPIWCGTLIGLGLGWLTGLLLDLEAQRDGRIL
ncbi:MAG TPA: hypothetical protein PK014_01970 [Thermoanaerobaculia bacterium]|nr:hypothetical protein [Thermoanaerobaculia bacterium]HUM28540.1 hypothetical protein [Thermoanaerobaculia bacterium]HXK66852.1 hypothetical protein [Thermoanaerobaculia bacterium]